MDTIESLGYLKGLLEGLDLGDNKKETKIFNAIVEVLSNITADLGDVNLDLDMLSDEIDVLDDELTDLEDYVYDEDTDDEDDMAFSDDDEFEVECPLCNTSFVIDADTAMDGSVACPNCGEMLEFEIEEADDEDED